MTYSVAFSCFEAFQHPFLTNKSKISRAAGRKIKTFWRTPVSDKKNGEIHIGVKNSQMRSMRDTSNSNIMKSHGVRFSIRSRRAPSRRHHRRADGAVSQPGGEKPPPRCFPAAKNTAAATINTNTNQFQIKEKIPIALNENR